MISNSSSLQSSRQQSTISFMLPLRSIVERTVMSNPVVPIPSSAMSNFTQKSAQTIPTRDTKISKIINTTESHMALNHPTTNQQSHGVIIAKIQTSRKMQGIKHPHE